MIQQRASKELRDNSSLESNLRRICATPNPRVQENAPARTPAFTISRSETTNTEVYLRLIRSILKMNQFAKIKQSGIGMKDKNKSGVARSFQ